MAKMTDKINLRGHVKIESVDNAGNRVNLLDEDNLIVTHGRMSIANTLAGVNGGLAITSIAFGNGGTLANNQAIAVSIAPTETNVISALSLNSGSDYIFSISTTSSASPTVISSITVPPTSALVGKSLSELALIQSDGSAFSIKRFPAIYMSTSISLIITWTIYF